MESVGQVLLLLGMGAAALAAGQMAWSGRWNLWAEPARTWGLLPLVALPAGVMLAGFSVVPLTEVTENFFVLLLVFLLSLVALPAAAVCTVSVLVLMFWTPNSIPGWLRPRWLPPTWRPPSLRFLTLGLTERSDAALHRPDERYWPARLRERYGGAAGADGDRFGFLVVKANSIAWLDYPWNGEPPEEGLVITSATGPRVEIETRSSFPLLRAPVTAVVHTPASTSDFDLFTGSKQTGRAAYELIREALTGKRSSTAGDRDFD